MVNFARRCKFVTGVLGIVSIGFLLGVASSLFSGEISHDSEQKRPVPLRLALFAGLALVFLLLSCVVMAIEKWEPAPAPEPTPPPRRIKKLNDSIFVLHAPEGPPSMDIIFFHGLIDHDDVDNAFWKTWLVKDDTMLIWPQEWLSENEFFPDARILSISYPRAGRKSYGDLDLYLMSENLVEDIIEQGIGQECKVFLVGHSLGGIAIEQLLLSAVLHASQLGLNHAQRDKVNLFIENVLGVFYYSTPHHAGSIYSMGMNKLSRNPDVLISLHKGKARINEQFKTERRLNHVLKFAMVEGLKTNFPGGSGFVVNVKSTRDEFSELNRLKLGHVHVHEQADHFTVSRAKDREDVVIRLLRDFILEILDSFGVPYRRRSPVCAPPSREEGDNHQNDSSTAGVSNKSVDVKMTESRFLS